MIRIFGARRKGRGKRRHSGLADGILVEESVVVGRDDSLHYAIHDGSHP